MNKVGRNESCPCGSGKKYKKCCLRPSLPSREQSFVYTDLDDLSNQVPVLIEQKKFAEAFSSFGVMSQVKRGDQLAQAYKIQGVPALAIEGKYLVGGKDFNEQLAIADKLIAKARSEKGGKGAGN